MDVVFFTPTTGVKSDGKGNLYLEIILFINWLTLLINKIAIKTIVLPTHLKMKARSISHP